MVRVLRPRSRAVVCTRQQIRVSIRRVKPLPVCASLSVFSYRTRARARIYLISARATTTRVTNSIHGRKRRKRQCNEADDLGGCIGGKVGR